MHQGGDPLGDTLVGGGPLELVQPGGREIRGPDVESLPGEEQGVAAVAGAQLQHLPAPGRTEEGGGVTCGSAGLS
ncbi:hypothetical protein GCM10010273_18210 [Streptomyces lavendulocolor]